jgi:hypothetical protein
MARFFTQSEVVPTTLRDKKIAVIGYGNQDVRRRSICGARVIRF